MPAGKLMMLVPKKAAPRRPARLAPMKRYNRNFKQVKGRYPAPQKGVGKPPLGQSFKIYTRYLEDPIDINNIAGWPATTNHVFSATSLFDPYRTGSGHQPLGFDQYMLFYDHYTVIAAKITLYFENTDDTNSFIVGVTVRDRAGAGDPANNLIENGNTAYKHLSPKGTDKSTCVIKKGVNVAKFMGRPDIMNVDEFRGSVSTNPTDECYFHVFATSTASAITDPGIVKFIAKIDYIAILTEPKRIDSS